MDLGLTHKFDLGEFEAMLIGNVNNLFDTEYISIVDNGKFDGYSGILRIWKNFNVGAKINF